MTPTAHLRDPRPGRAGYPGRLRQGRGQPRPARDRLWRGSLRNGMFVVDPFSTVAALPRKGDWILFDDIGELLKYHITSSDTDFRATWSTTTTPRSGLAEDAWYVRSAGFTTPMGWLVGAFANEEEAHAFQAEHGGCHDDVGRGQRAGMDRSACAGRPAPWRARDPGAWRGHAIPAFALMAGSVAHVGTCTLTPDSRHPERSEGSLARSIGRRPTSVTAPSCDACGVECLHGDVSASLNMTKSKGAR